MLLNEWLKQKGFNSLEEALQDDNVEYLKNNHFEASSELAAFLIGRDMNPRKQECKKCIYIDDLNGWIYEY